MPDACTVTAGSLMVMIPAVPPLPIAAMSPLTQGVFATPSVQLAAVVLHVPLPSAAAVGELPLASQVNVWPCANFTNSGARANARQAARLQRLPLRVRIISLLQCGVSCTINGIAVGG